MLGAIVARVRYVESGGERLSVIGLGTYQFGSKDWGYGEHYASHDAIDILNRALDLGVNLVDTAELYGFGRSESIVGRTIADRRDKVFVASKVFPVLPIPQVLAWRAASSARRLEVSQIDLYQLHWSNPVVPLSAQMRGMRALQRAGLIRQIGVSNFSLVRWRAAELELGGPVFSNQVRLSLVARRPLDAMTKWAEANARVVIAYSPLAQGLLSGRYDESNRPGAMRASSPAFLPENLRRARPLLETLKAVATAHGVTSAQVALAWVLRYPQVVAIPGASTVSQLERNVEAADIELSDDDAAQLLAAAEAYQPTTGAAAAAGVVRARLKR